MSSILSSALSALSGTSSRNATHKAVQTALDTLEGTSDYANQLYNTSTQNLSNMMDSTTALYGDTSTAASDLSAAKEALSNLEGYTASDFTYDKTVDDFYDPAFNLSVNMANDAINGSQAAGGNLFSSETGNKLAAQNQVLATQIYNDAQNAYNSDKSLESSIWSAEEGNKQAEANSAANIAQTNYNVANDTASALSSANQAYYTGLNDATSNYYNNLSNYAAQVANLQASDPGTSSTWMRKLSNLIF